MEASIHRTVTLTYKQDKKLKEAEGAELQWTNLGIVKTSDIYKCISTVSQKVKALSTDGSLAGMVQK